MGSTCQTCCGPAEYKPIINTEVKNQDWADAVQKGNFTGIKILHHSDPDLVNEVVDENGTMAIHYAVKTKNEKLLEYLLNNGANINAQGGKEYNSALHEAILLQDFSAIKKLYSYGINDQLRNIHGKLAIDLCNKKYKREFMKAKQFKAKHKEEYLQKHAKNIRRTQTGVMLAGMNLNDTNEKTIRRYVKETDHRENFYRRKEEEIAHREMAVTSFGDECGIDADEIAMTIRNMELSKLWQKLTKRNTNAVTKQTEIYKILYGLTLVALKKKNPRAKKPPQTAVKKLTTILVKKLPKKKGKATLEKNDFEKQFAKYLFEIHDEMKEKEENEL